MKTADITSLIYSFSVYSLLFVSLFFDFQNADRFELLKIVMLASIGALLFFTILTLLFQKIRYTKNQISILVLLLVAKLYLLFNIYINSCNYSELYKLFCGAAFFLLTAYIPFKLRFQVFAVSFFCILTLIWGFYQKFYGFNYIIANFQHSLQPGALERFMSGRIYSAFVLPNIFASYLCITMIFLIPKINSIKPTAKKMLYVQLFFMLLAMFYTKTISVFVSLAAALAVVFLHQRINLKRNKFLILYFLAAIAGLAVLAGYSRDWTHFYNSSVKYHISNYISAINMWKDNNIFTGIGFGRFGEFYPSYVLSYGNEVIYAHNYYLQCLAETGIIGVTLLITFIFLVFRNIVSLKNNYYLLFILYFSINSFFSMDANVLATIICFAFFAGLILRDSPKKK